MASKRMYTTKVTDSDAFIEMSASAQALYFHLNQSADDDGFNNQIQVAMMKAHASSDDLKVLMVKKFILRFENGVIVIKHWRMHNTLRKDRYTPTNFQEELKFLGVKENGAYTLRNNDIPMISDVGCQSVATDKNSIGKVRLGKVRLDKKNIYGEFENISLTDDETEKLKSLYGIKFNEAVEKLSSYIKANGKKYKDFYAVLNKSNWVYREIMKNTIVADFKPKPYGVACNKEDGYSL